MVGGLTTVVVSTEVVPGNVTVTSDVMVELGGTTTVVVIIDVLSGPVTVTSDVSVTPGNVVRETTVEVT